MMNLAAGKCKGLVVKQAAVQAVLRSSLLASLWLGFSPTLLADPLAALSQQLFPQNRDKAQCALVSRGPAVDLAKVNAELHKTVNEIFTRLKEKEEDGFAKMFHPLLKVKSSIGERIFANLDVKYRTPRQFSVYRVWAFNSPDGKKVAVPCDDEGVMVTTMYGYPLHVGVWFQVMGQEELGRIFVFLAPKDNRWWIVGWHFQQWTQNGKDYEVWAKDGLNLAAEKQPLLAHIRFDVAQKLLFGGDFLEFPVKEQIIASRDQNLTKEGLLAEVQKLFSSDKVIYAGTVLAEEGVGILVREVVNPRLSTHDLQAHCLKKGKAIVAAGWLKGAGGGIRCEFNVKGENPNQPGKLGGFYFTQQEIKQKA